MGVPIGRVVWSGRWVGARRSSVIGLSALVLMIMLARTPPRLFSEHTGYVRAFPWEYADRRLSGCICW
ncbi:hypothetical protein WDV93_13045 [Pantoea ananatis]